MNACDPSHLSQEESPVKERRLVAIVDDEKAVCRAIGRIVISAGFESETFSSAKEFLQSCRERRPDCLILDLRLPGMSGLELQQQLATAQNPSRPRLMECQSFPLSLREPGRFSRRACDRLSADFAILTSCFRR